MENIQFNHIYAVLSLLHKYKILYKIKIMITINNFKIKKHNDINNILIIYL